MGMLSVSEAQQRLIADCEICPVVTVPLEQCYQRVVADDIAAKMTQPPFDASAMDGYALCQDDTASLPVTLKVIGESAAGHPFDGSVRQGEAVRIFTGAEVPTGADVIALQEDCERAGDQVTIREANPPAKFIRPKGYDFALGDVLLDEGEQINYRHMTMLASMNVADVLVREKPRVGIIATGDELCLPGREPKAGQIVSSIPFGMKRLIQEAGGEADFIGIALDNLASLDDHISRAEDYDILVTIGGASVGDHDLVQQALKNKGMTLDFWRIAMRPGKPLMVGSLKKADGGLQKVVGLPGNPVSALICTLMFVVPLIRSTMNAKLVFARQYFAKLSNDVPENGPRQHYMRALAEHDGSGSEDGAVLVRSLEDQDSSLQAKFAHSNGLIVRQPHAKAAKSGDLVEILPLNFGLF